MEADVAVIGAGAAGLATGIFFARRRPERSVVLLDGARKIGAKILISGGGRCNVTNSIVGPGDFRGGNANVVRRILNEFTVGQTREFFGEIGVALHEEAEGKLFPDSHRSRTILDALLAESSKRGVRLLEGHRVTGLGREGDRFAITTDGKRLSADRVVLATGGVSIPKSGSDGFGYQLAAAFGHSLVPTTPALVPLLLEGDFHPPLSGISHPVEIFIRAEGGKPLHISGAMLWTHFGVSGPAALDASRHWHRARLEGRKVSVSVRMVPGADFESLEKRLLEAAMEQPKSHVRKILAGLLPAQVAAALLARLGLAGDAPMARFSKTDRRVLIRALLDWPLPVSGSRGYDHAEVTAGGVPLEEVDPRTLGSRLCPGLYFSGEVLDVDGRLGGFNFQWAWSSAWVVARGMAGGLSGTGPG